MKQPTPAEAEMIRRTLSFAHPSTGKAIRQLVSTSVLAGAVWGLQILLFRAHPWWALALALPGAGCIMRLFILQHDCGHGSFLPWRWGNDALGRLLGVFTMTPYSYWRRTHALHHANHGKLGHRKDLGYVEVLTTAEYSALSAAAKLRYRLSRHPASFYLVGPLYQFFFKHRFPWDVPASWRVEWRDVLLTNLGLAGLVGGLGYSLGWSVFLPLATVDMYLAAAIAIWFFHVQHTFQGGYYAKESTWSFVDSALRGSSFYDVPRVMAWFTGDIGFHHVHHLAPQVPNYRLREAFAAVPELQAVPRMSLGKSVRCAWLHLWDLDRECLVGYPPRTPPLPADLAARSR